MRQEERERTEQAETVRLWRLLILSMTGSIAAAVLLVTVVAAPILLIPAFALLAFAWTQRDRWHLSRGERMTMAAIFLVVFASYLIQEFTD